MKRKYPTMMNRLNAISDTLNGALNEISSLSNDLLTKANSTKASILQLLATLGETRNTIHGLSKMCGDFGAACLDLSEDCDVIVDNIDSSFDNFEGMPEGSYETFVGFCDDCGVELHITDDFEQLDPLSVLCAECALRADAEDEGIEDEDTFEPLKETVDSEVATNV
jgi:hypothetical protein